MTTIKNSTIAVVGLGYVGLPLAIAFGKKIQTIGYDTGVGQPIGHLSEIGFFVPDMEKAMEFFRNNTFDLILLALCTLLLGVGFYLAEKNAKDPILNFKFFRIPGFALGNIIGFCASFSTFALFAYAPLFLQGALGSTPLQVGYAMLSLSLGWSLGSLIIGRVMHLVGQKRATLAGVLLMVLGTGLTLGFSRETSMTQCFLVFQVVGFGMGFITLSTLLIVQDSLKPEDLGVGTSFHQFSRTLGGTIGVGLCGGLVTSRLMDSLELAGSQLPQAIVYRLNQSMENLFQADFQALIPQGAAKILQEAVANGVYSAFIIVFTVSLIGLCLVAFLPGKSA